MSNKISNAVMAISLIMGAQASSYAGAPQSFITAQLALVDSFPGGAAGVFQKLKDTGWGSCYVSNPSNGFCANYFVSSSFSVVANGQTYRGYPVYQSETPGTPSLINKYSASSRATGGAVGVASTGCFPSGTNWPQNHNDEKGIAPADYAVKILKRAMQDSADPCNLNQLYLDQAPQGASSSALLAQNKIKRNLTGDCLIQVPDPINPSSSGWKIFAVKSTRVCKRLKELARWSNGANGTGQLPLFGSGTIYTNASYSQALRQATTTTLNSLNLKLNPADAEADGAAEAQK